MTLQQIENLIFFKENFYEEWKMNYVYKVYALYCFKMFKNCFCFFEIIVE
jgi:hypothetical protein